MMMGMVMNTSTTILMTQRKPPLETTRTMDMDMDMDMDTHTSHTCTYGHGYTQDV